MKTGFFKFKVTWIVITLILVVAAFILGSFKNRMRRPDRLSPEFIIERMADKLDLTEAQIDSLSKIREETRDKREAIFTVDENRFNPIMFFDIIIEGEPKRIEFEEGFDNFRENMIEMDKFTADQMMKIHELLDDNQKVKLQELIKTFAEKAFRYRQPKSRKP